MVLPQDLYTCAKVYTYTFTSMHYTIYWGEGGGAERREDRERKRERIRIIKVNFAKQNFGFYVHTHQWKSGLQEGVPGNKRHPHYMTFTMEKSPAWKGIASS